MSLKSFDKLCEKLITSQSGSEREVLDERQKIMHTKILVETLAIMCAAGFVNCVIMDLFYKWAESYAPTLLLIGTICTMYNIIRCAASGCYVGVNGNFTHKYTAAMLLFSSVISVVTRFLNITDKGTVIINGALSNDFLFAVSFALLGISGVMILIVLRRIDKDNSSETGGK